MLILDTVGTLNDTDIKMHITLLSMVMFMISDAFQFIENSQITCSGNYFYLFYTLGRKGWKWLSYFFSVLELV